ncbi:MAG: pyruvate synthase subunit beta [candidate division NC10 bacterium]|nr:pyruvate synthase subunit beta [candidate division NC10 bacterium]
MPSARPIPTLPKSGRFTLPPVLIGTACEGCGALPAADILAETLGAKMAVVCPASCAATFSLSYTGMAWRVPFVHWIFESAPAAATGLRHAYDARGLKDVHVVCFAGDSGTADIGFQALSGAASRNENILYICYDNEVAMNTQGQATSTSTPLARTPTTPSGAGLLRKDVPRIMAAHGIPYVATAAVSHPDDYRQKLRRAARITGFRYLQVLTPCPIAWGYPHPDTLDVTRLAVETGLWMLYEVDGGKWRVSHRPKRRRPVREYLSLQRRFAALRPREMQALQRRVDGAWRGVR